MRTLLSILSVLILITICQPAVGQAPVVGPNTERHVYIDDDDQRSLADLRFDIDEQNAQNLRITISALGPQVEPIAGFRGISGGNRYTAEELGLILDGNHAAKVVTKFEDGKTAVGRLLQGAVGRLPERRLLPNGHIDFLGQTALHYPLEMIVDPKTNSSGRRTTMVVIGGQARLRVRYVIVNGKVEDLEVQSLGNDKFLAQQTPQKNNRPGRFVLTVAEEKTQPVEFVAPTSDAIWNQRDLEGKWVLLTSSIQHSPEKISDWVEFLKQKHEHTLLEWMAICIPDAFKSYGVGNALIIEDAPQWVRVAAWHHNGPTNLGHGIQQATNILLRSSPGVAEHWLQTHQANLDNWKSSLLKVYEALQKDKTEPKDSSRYLPPLQSENVFRLLGYSEDLVEFGDRTQAEEGVVYRHQMIRAINAIPVSGRREARLLKAVRELTWHKDVDIRIAALLAHTYLLPKSLGTEQFEDFVTMADDKTEPQKIREAALMTFSYHNHPSVILKLHQVAADPLHGAWNSAVSRIGDIGLSWSEPLLKDLKNERLSDAQQMLLADSQKRLTERCRRRNSVGGGEMANLIMQAVFAEKASDLNAKYLLDSITQQAESMTDKQLKILRKNCQFERRPKIWMPCDAGEFGARYEKIRLAISQ